MTDNYSTGTTGTADTATQEAAQVAADAHDAGQHVAATAKEQAGSVVGEAKGQAKDLLGQASSELKDQAGVQQQRAAAGLRSLSDELASMADRSDGDGVASDIVRNLSGRAGSVASWLDSRDPGSLLDDVKSYAARKPGTFIAIAAGAGILAGRLTKALTAEAKDDSTTAGTSAATVAGRTPVATTPDPAPSHEPAFEPPLRTQAAFAENDETIAEPDGAVRYRGEPTFDDLLDQTIVPGLRTNQDDQP